jgi:sterol desaturase/sphingolipid hydroxylase (fatty acid hydroxylase superfamily)
MDIETFVGLAIPIYFIALLVIERLAPRPRAQPRVKWWLLKCSVFFLITLVLNSVPGAVLAGAIGPYAPVHLDQLPLAGQILIGFAVSDFVSYWVHRAMHRWQWLWRWTHQMHHSAERVDIAGLAYVHPFDVLLGATLPTFAIVALGISPAGAALAGLASVLTGFISHLDVRTPRWLGYIIQRPEAHAIHHTRDLHAYNYGTIMLWDIAFGTFRNPADYPTEPFGFWDGASKQTLRMLVGRDVATPTARG